MQAPAVPTVTVTQPARVRVCLALHVRTPLVCSSCWTAPRAGVSWRGRAGPGWGACRRPVHELPLGAGSEHLPRGTARTSRPWGINRLEPGRGTGSSVHLSLYGMLFLTGAVVAARASKHALARDLLNEGHGIASQLGYDGNERFTAFGPTNVRLHQIAVFIDVGDGAGAVAAARPITPDGLSRLPKERRANYYLDLAHGHRFTGHRDDAVRTLLQAEALFPDEVCCRPAAIDLVDDLRRTSSGTRSRELDQLAARIGLADG